MKPYGIIYKVTNMESFCTDEMCYIGQTKRPLSIRRKYHYYDTQKSNNKFFNALKSGIKFKWEILKTCYNKKELDDNETYYIEYYNAIVNGYNTCKGGKAFPILIGYKNGRYGDHRTLDEIHGKEKADIIRQKLKISAEKIKGLKSEITRKRMLSDQNPMKNPIHRAKLKNRVFSDEHRKKLSEANKRRYNKM